MKREYWESLGREVEYDEAEIERWLETHPQLTNFLSENLSIVLRRVDTANGASEYHAAIWYRGCEAGTLLAPSLGELIARLRERVSAGPVDETFDEW